MSFKEELKAVLNEKLQAGSTSLLESIQEFAADSGLNESEHTTLVSAVSKYVDGANSKLVDTIVESAIEKVDTKETELTESFDEKFKQLNEASEGYATYLREGVEDYSEYLKEEYETLAEAYVQDEVIPDLSESVDAYMNIMVAKLDEEGENGINVLKAAKYDELVESLQGLGFNAKQIAESEEELSEVDRLTQELAEARNELKSVGKRLTESTSKTNAEEVLASLTEGLTDLQTERVKKMASKLDESKDSYKELVEDIVDVVRGNSKPTPKLDEEMIDEDAKPVNDGYINRYVSAAKPKQTRLG